MYVLDDGYLLPANCQDAYCRQCKSLESVEHIPSIESVQDAFTEEDRNTLLKTNFEASWYKSALQRKRRLEWRLNRTASARCLICGGSDFFVVGLDREMVDPISGKRFVWKDCVFFDSSVSLEIRLRPDGTVLTTWKPTFGRRN